MPSWSPVRTITGNTGGAGGVCGSVIRSADFRAERAIGGNRRLWLEFFADHASSGASSEVGPDHRGDGRGRLGSADLCRLYADEFGLSTIALRIGSYDMQPTPGRMQRTWLSPADAVRAFVAAMTTERHLGIFYAVSANRDRWWNLEAGTVIGYLPEDDAAGLDAVEPFDPAAPQGGPYATAEFSLERMRR